MEINVAKERILVLASEIKEHDAHGMAWEKKTTAFDAFSKVASFLSRPKDDDFELTYKEHRYQPFWHVVAKARYVYDRSADYQVPLSGREVEAITVLKTKYNATNGHVHIPVIEHCVQNELDDVCIDGVTSKHDESLKEYISRPSDVVAQTIEKLVPKGAIIVPPVARVSGLMREALAKMIKGIQADTILEESVEVPNVDLYYRPIFAINFIGKVKIRTRSWKLTA